MTDGPELLRIGVDGVVPVRWSLEKSDSEPGTLTGWASVYNVVDQQADVVVPGAFRKTLSDWRASKRVIPLTLDHQNTAEGVIGSLAEVQDTSFGLKTTFRFSSASKAQDARTNAREGHLNGLSIFGPIFKHGFDTIAGSSVRVLKEVGLFFVGLTPMPANQGSLVLTAKAVSNTPWSQFSQADYTEDQYRRACLIDTGQGEGKERYSLPVKEPSGTINRNGVHAAAAALAGARGGLQVSAEKKATAARALVRIYRSDLDEDPPENLLRIAGMASSVLALPDDWVTDMRSALSITVPEARAVAVDMLVKTQYATTLEPPPAVEEAAEDEDQATPDDEAAKYALSFAGMDGPGDSPPDGEPSDSLADLFASVDAKKHKSELDDLESEIRKVSEQ